MFEIGLEWWRGALQCLVYGVAIVAICWLLSKIELKGGGESPTQQEKGRTNA
jgi:hypothetical protein